MNIIYATRATVPYPSAASLNTVQMCESLVSLGHHVTLAVGRKLWRRPRTDWAAFYGFRPSFEVARLFEVPRSGIWFDNRIAQLARRRNALIYLRYPRLLATKTATFVRSLIELHGDVAPADRRLIARRLADSSLAGIVVITHTLRHHLLGTPELRPFGDRIVVAPDAVNVTRFHTVPAEAPACHVGYVGGLFPGKGIEQIVDVAAALPSTTFEIFGGTPRQLRDWKRQCRDINNVAFQGRIPPAAVPNALARFGIVLLPNQPSVRLPGGEDIGAFTSPMKLFEYMAAGRAIIASDLPHLREVLRDEHNCLLVPHADIKAWTAAIARLQHDKPLRNRLADQARRDAVDQYSYERRFQRILREFRLSA